MRPIAPVREVELSGRRPRAQARYLRESAPPRGEQEGRDGTSSIVTGVHNPRVCEASVIDERGSAEGQWRTWLDQVANLAERPSTEPDVLEIWGYTGRPSYAPGEVLELHVSTTATTWGFEVWRDGSTFELLHRALGLPGLSHAIGDDVVSEGCNWPVSATLAIPEDWQSGGFIVVLRAEQNGSEVSQDAFFVLRAASPGTKSKLALVVATYTWLEYNDWGGGCGYSSSDHVVEDTSNPDARHGNFKRKLSFQRPWSRGLIRAPGGFPRIAEKVSRLGASTGMPAADWAMSHGYSIWSIASGWARYDGLTARWLESEGYEPELLSQWDLDRDPSILDNYRLVITSGHDEYWSAAGRKVLDDFIEAGGRYARFAGNICWQVRLDEDLSSQVCHKYFPEDDPQSDDLDPARRTGAFESLHINWPPVSTFGANGFRGGLARQGAVSPRGPGGFIVYRPEHWSFEGADVYYGDVVGGELPVVGYELDGVDYTFANGLPSPTGDDGTPSSLEILALTPVTWDEENHGQSGSLLTMGDFTLRFAATSLLGEDTPANRDKLRYGSAVITSMPTGLGEVFCAGTTEWCYALAAHEEQCEIITRNVVNRFLA